MEIIKCRFGFNSKSVTYDFTNGRYEICPEDNGAEFPRISSEKYKDL